MRRRIKYRLPKARRRSRSRFLWLLALVVLGVAGWMWWQSGDTRTPESKPKATPAPPPFHTRQQPQRAPAQVTPQPAPPMQATPQPAPPVEVVPKPRPVPKAIAEPPPQGFPRPVRDVFEAQLALGRLGISAGSLDGLIGSQTRSALRAFQQREHLPLTGELDDATRERLLLAGPPYTTYTITTNDLAHVQPLNPTWLGKSKQSALDYETLLELVAEKSHSHPNLIRRFNPSLVWTNLAPGTGVQVPDVVYTDPGIKAAFITISLSGKVLQAYDSNTNLLAHFPCSIAQRVEKRPVGELHVVAIAPNPDYTFDPALFPESAEAQQLNTKLILPPGPNSPVGVAWISLDKPGYGIHGTPSPEKVGRTESHGCFRLANWNAEHLIRLVWIGMPVYVEL